MEFIKEYIQNQVKNRRIGIFWTGIKAIIAVGFLENIGIHEYVFFDNDQVKVGKMFDTKMILDVSEISKNYFILISTVHFRAISEQLCTLGLEELEDYIWALELEYYDALIRWRNEPKVPEISFSDLEELERKLSLYVDVEKIDWFDEADFEKFEQSLGFQEIYNKQNNKRYRRKIREYYCVERLLKFDEWEKNDTYIDVGAAESPFAKYLRENKGINAYALDLKAGRYSELPYYIQEDATRMHFKDNEVTAISLQSSFEMFLGEADMNFIEEAARVLRKGGKVIICPLYLHKQYLSTVSPNYYHVGGADKDSLECIRLDCRGNVPLGRFYSIAALNERVLKNAKLCGLFPRIYSLAQNLVEKDGFVYLKFILCLEKEGRD